MYYVKMIDKFLTGWGEAQDKTARLIIECETLQEAEIVEQNAKHRTDMKNISIVTTKPTFNKATNQVSYRTKDEMGNWFKPNYFKK